MYTIKTERLGLRNWRPEDLPLYIEMNQDKDVMAFFPNLFSEEDSAASYQRHLDHFEKYGFCYFAADLLETGEFIGFIGMMHQDYESHFTPCVDIGWRLRKDFWGKGYAPEGARACLAYAFDHLQLQELFAVAPVLNKNSERVMQKIGMENAGTFEHPKIAAGSPLRLCNLYKASQSSFH